MNKTSQTWKKLGRWGTTVSCGCLLLFLMISSVAAQDVNHEGKNRAQGQTQQPLLVQRPIPLVVTLSVALTPTETRIVTLPLTLDLHVALFMTDTKPISTEAVVAQGAITPTVLVTLTAPATMNLAVSPSAHPPAAATLAPAPTCAEIRSAYNKMASEQWLTYARESLHSKWLVNWQRRIRLSVERSFLAGGYPLFIDDLGLQCGVYYVIEDESQAKHFVKGQQVNLTGQIDYVDTLFGDITLHLKDYTVEIK